MLTKRTNILFDENIWKKLTDLAKSQGISVGNLVRKAVEEKYSEKDSLEARKKVIEHIEKIRPHFKGKLDYKALINHGRKY